MGYGDEIIATGEAKKLKESCPDTVQVALTKHGQVYRWNGVQEQVFQNHPYLVDARSINRNLKTSFLEIFCGCRPYHDKKKKNTKKQDYYSKTYRTTRGEIFFSEQEKLRINKLKEKYSDYILLNPTVKKNLSGDNRDWGVEKWRKLAQILLDSRYKILQTKASPANRRVGVGVNDRLGIPEHDTPSFRDLCMLVASVKAVVTTEGGVNHLAAALNKKTLTIFGGRIHPSTLGYEDHNNIYIDIDGSPCWMNAPCEHCKKCLSMISPEFIAEELKGML